MPPIYPTVVSIVSFWRRRLNRSRGDQTRKKTSDYRAGVIVSAPMRLVIFRALENGSDDARGRRRLLQKDQTNSVDSDIFNHSWARDNEEGTAVVV